MSKLLFRGCQRCAKLAFRATFSEESLMTLVTHARDENQECKL